MALGIDLFKSNSSTARKLDRKTQRLNDTRSQVAVNRAERAQADFMDDANREKLMLNEQLARRGMAFGTQAMSDRDRLQRKINDQINTLGEDITMARQGGDLNDYTHKAGKRFKALDTIETIIDTGMQAASFGMGLPGGGGGAGTSGLDEAIW